MWSLAALASPGNLIQRQILGPTLDLAVESESLRAEPSNLCFNSFVLILVLGIYSLLLPLEKIRYLSALLDRACFFVHGLSLQTID